MKYLNKFSAILLVLLLTLVVNPVQAQIVVDVSGNGADTTNTVTVDQSQTTQTEQTNEANVVNDVVTEANTGGNTVSDSTGDTQITTGDILTQTTVSNDLNNSEVIIDPAGQELALNISDNGAGSTNLVDANVTLLTNVNVNQTANIQNNISIYANTGGNIASNNSGEVIIDTGDIKAYGNLVNSVNQSYVFIASTLTDVAVNVTNNGVDSINQVNVNLGKEINQNRVHLANIVNNIYANLNTGGNVAWHNLDQVLIKTGDIDFAFDVSNEPINVGATFICCDDGEPVPPGNPADQALPPLAGGPTPKTNGTTNGNGAATVEDVLGAITDILPSTGASAIHFWMLAVMYLLTFLAGLYLRLRAGRSPTYFRGYQLLGLS